MVSGMINSAMHGGRINEGILNYALFDSMNISDFNAHKCPDDYDFRYNMTALYANDTKLLIARNTTVNIIKDVEQLSEQLYNDGFEGLVLKPKHHMYTFTRSPNWVKIKEVNPADLLCTGTTPGKGKYEGMIGALICSGIVEGKYIIVKISGMKDYHRAMNPNYFINKTIELKYNCVIQDQQTGQWSLFSPRFNGVRIDK
jgi:hypothetical protein